MSDRAQEQFEPRENGVTNRLRLLLLLLLALPGLAFGLSPDELRLFQRVREIAAAPIEDFTVLGETAGVPDGHYRYQLAFLGYGLCSIVQSEPALRAEGRTLFTRLVEKMEHQTTVAYWKALGYEGDGLTRENAMYRGHLNLMYALAHDHFGETRFDAPFHALSRALFNELGGNRPICCEPDQLFVQCNAVALLSLCLHDRSFGTGYTSVGKRLVSWARQHMPLEGTMTLVREDYHPSSGMSSARQAGYANAWALAFLAPVPGFKRYTEVMYTEWRQTFVGPWALAGIVNGAPATETLSMEEMLTSSLLATTFGLLAAREAGDETLHRRLARTVAYVEYLVETYEKLLPSQRRAQAHTFRTIALFARTFRGWSQVLGLRHDTSASVQAAGSWIDVSSSLLERLTNSGAKPAWPGGCSGVVANRLNGDITIKIVGRGLWRSSDKGRTWQRIDNDTISGRDETGWATSVDQNAPTRMASFSLDGLAGWTADGHNWKSLTSLGRNWDFGSVDWGAPEPTTIIAAKHETSPPGEVYVTTDRGSTWKKLAIYLNESRDRISMVGALDATTFVYSKGEGIYRSTDTGATWSKVSPANPQTRIPVLFHGTHYLGSANGLLVSKDKGASWQPQGAVVNTWQGPFFGHDEKEMVVVGNDGVFVTHNAGETWAHVAGLKPKEDNFVFSPNWFGCYAWDPVNNALYASAMGNPVYKLELGKSAETRRD